MREAERPAEKEIVVTPDHRQLLGDGPAVKGGPPNHQSLSAEGGNLRADPSLGGDWVPLASQVGDTELLPRGGWSPAGV